MDEYLSYSQTSLEFCTTCSRVIALCDMIAMAMAARMCGQGYMYNGAYDDSDANETLRSMGERQLFATFNPTIYVSFTVRNIAFHWFFSFMPMKMTECRGYMVSCKSQLSKLSFPHKN